MLFFRSRYAAHALARFSRLAKRGCAEAPASLLLCMRREELRPLGRPRDPEWSSSSLEQPPGDHKWAEEQSSLLVLPAVVVARCFCLLRAHVPFEPLVWLGECLRASSSN